MIATLLMITGILFLALQLQDKLGVPSPLGLILLSFTAHYAFQQAPVLTGDAEHFYSLLNLFGGHSHLHLSGILACICATITVHHVMTRAIDEENTRIHLDEATLQQEAGHRDTSYGVISNMLQRIKATLAERDRHLRNQEDIQLLSMVANTILFVAMAEMIDLQLLWQYRVEILAMFIASTVIRAVMMALFAWLTNQTERMANVNPRWWGVLTFAGINRAQFIAEKHAEHH